MPKRYAIMQQTWQHHTARRTQQKGLQGLGIRRIYGYEGKLACLCLLTPSVGNLKSA